jgi:rubrerythrin
MKKKYKCDNCGFTFESEKDAVKCPYCSKDTVTLQMSDDEALVDIDKFLD